jgi:hypothetical protein
MGIAGRYIIIGCIVFIIGMMGCGIIIAGCIPMN